MMLLEAGISWTGDYLVRRPVLRFPEITLNHAHPTSNAIEKLVTLFHVRLEAGLYICQSRLSPLLDKYRKIEGDLIVN